jgi:tripartite-type tricarboxylate transporter receptor subunit TctC
MRRSEANAMTALRSVAYGCIVFVMAGNAAAQSYPAKPIRFIVPFVPGGSTDIFARLIAPGLGESLGQQVVVDNRGGAGGTIGTEQASRAAPDGYTILLGSANTAMNVSLYGNRSIDPLKEFKPVALLASAPNIFVVHPSLPVKTVRELIALAKAKPGQINYASGGNGSTPHLAAELFKTMTSVDLVHIPYKGTGPAIVAVLSGEASVVFPAAGAVLPQVRSGRLRALAICSLTRSDAAPDLPTVSESGVAGYESAQWYGVLVPAATPNEIAVRLNQELAKVVQNPNVKARLLKDATTVVEDTSPAAFGAYLRSEIAKWDKVVKFSGARVD